MALTTVPVPGQTLANSRDQISGNFNVIDVAFQVDHVDYNLTNQGMHNRVSFPTQSMIPTPLAGIVQLYSQVSSITGQPELVFAHQLGSTAPVVARIVEFTSAGWANPGWTRLPSGILLKWHTGISMASLKSLTINLNSDVPGSPNFVSTYADFPATTSPGANYNNIIGIQTLSHPNVTFAQFGLVNPPAGTTISYLAIGL